MSLCRQSSGFKFILLPSVTGFFNALLILTLLGTPAAMALLGSVAVGSNGGKPTRSSASLGGKTDSYLQLMQNQCLKLG